MHDREEILLVTPPLISDNASVPYPSLPYLAASLERAGFQVRYLNLNLPFQIVEKNACITACKNLNPATLAAAVGEYPDFLYLVELFCKMANELGPRLSINHNGGVIVDSLYLIDHFFQPVWQAYAEGLMPRVSLDLGSKSFSAFSTSERFDDFARKALGEPRTLDRVVVVAITVPMVDNVGYALRLAQLVKEVRPEIRVVAGGTAFSALPSWVVELIRNAGYFDAVAEGPGEDVILEIAQRGGNDAGTLGIISRQTYGQSRKAVNGPTLASLMPIKLPAPETGDCSAVEVALVQSRGCYWGECVYCSYPELYGSNQYQERSIEVLVNEVEHHASVGFRRFRLINDTLRQGYAVEFASTLTDRGIEVEWRSFMRAEPFTESALERITRSGGNKFVIGLETVSDRLLRVVKKGVKKENADILFRRFANVGMKVEVNVMPDLPTSTVEEALETLSFLEEHVGVIYRLNVSKLVVPIRSPMARAPQVYGLKLLDEQPTFLDQSNLLYFTRIFGATDAELAPVIRRYEDLSRRINNSHACTSSMTESGSQNYVFRHAREVISCEPSGKDAAPTRRLELGYDVRTGSYEYERY